MPHVEQFTVGEPPFNPAPGPYRAEGWERTVCNDAEGNTFALVPAAHLGLPRCKDTARLLVSSWQMRQALLEIIRYCSVYRTSDNTANRISHIAEMALPENAGPR